jgi:protein SCO1/2
MRRPLAQSLLLASLALGLLWGLAFGLRRLQGPSFYGSPVLPPQPAYDFHLLSAQGPVRLDAFRGKAVFLYFGYTHCPDVCPATLLRLATIARTLPSSLRSNVVFVMITIDPARDTPQAMARYVEAFDPHFLGLSGPPSAIQKTLRAYDVYAHKVVEGGTYFFNHSSFVDLIGPAGRLRVRYNYSQLGDPQGVLHDLELLLAHSGIRSRSS